MPRASYSSDRTALLFIDPYNDFLSEGGKLWPLVADVATANRLIENLKSVMLEVRRRGIRVFIAPHRRWEPHALASWQHASGYQLQSDEAQVFAKGTWGGEWRAEFAPKQGDLIAKEHWNASGFANTDLDFLLKQHAITHVVLIGLLANTCVEGTARFAAELGYHVTLVRDATAAFSLDRMHAAHELNGPTFAHAILNTAELIEAMRQSGN